MKKQNKVFIIFVIVFFLVWLSVLGYVNIVVLDNYTIPDKIEKEFVFIKNSQIDKKKIFEVMSNPENFPKALPHNVLSVKIINQTKNEIIAEEEISEAGISTKILVKHVIIPYEKHIIEILEGDAQGTTITINFESENLTTIIKSKIKMKVKGMLLPFGFLPENNLKSAWNSVISGFEKYAESSTSIKKENYSKILKK